MGHPVNVSSSVRNVFVCVVHHTYGLFSFLSVSFRECGFLRKTIIHSSCRLGQDAESSELHIQQSRGKPTNSTEHSGEACSETSWCFFHVLSFCQWNALWKVREGGPPGGGAGSLGLGGSAAGPACSWQKQVLCGQKHPQHTPWDCLRLQQMSRNSKLITKHAKKEAAVSESKKHRISSPKHFSYWSYHT